MFAEFFYTLGIFRAFMMICFLILSFYKFLHRFIISTSV